MTNFGNKTNDRNIFMGSYDGYLTKPVLVTSR